MASISKRYTFVPGVAHASEVNADFDDIIDFLNNQLVHVDGSKAMTGPLNLPNTDPTANNHAARKLYVDNKCKDIYSVKAATDIFVPSATEITIPTATVESSRGGFFLNGGYGIVAPATGLYRVSGSVSFYGINGGGGVAMAYVKRNGALLASTRASLACPDSPQLLDIALPATPVPCAQGEALNLITWQNTGVANTASAESWLHVEYLGA